MAGNINTFVIDSSFILGFLLPDENNQLVVDFFNKYALKEIRFMAPLLLSFEVVNGLRNAYLSSRINQLTVFNLINDFLSYKIITKEVDLPEVFKISQDKNLSIYDATYLCLAKSENIPLLTLDEKLATAR